jgi:dTDP-4-dehydrorhamnose reductase
MNRKRIPWGTFHFCGKGNTTWHEFATRIIEECKGRTRLRTSRVTPIRTSDYPTAASRPA